MIQLSDIQLSDNERVVLSGMISEQGFLLSALQKFAEAKKQACESSASAELRQRRLNEAADYAARADVYAVLIAEIESFAKNP